MPATVPTQVDLVECHATSTVQGDIQEVKALNARFRPTAEPADLFQIPDRPHLGCFRHQQPHPRRFRHAGGDIPPHPELHTPDPEIGLEAAGFHVPTQPEDWPQPSDRPRRLQVNAFGFGGANYVVQLESCRDGSGRVMALPRHLGRQRCGIQPPARAGPAPVDGVSFFTGELAGQPHRVGGGGPHRGRSPGKAGRLWRRARRGAPYLKNPCGSWPARGCLPAPAGQSPPLGLCVCRSGFPIRRAWARSYTRPSPRSAMDGQNLGGGRF